jgi:hypothetical protein
LTEDRLVTVQGESQVQRGLRIVLFCCAYAAIGTLSACAHVPPPPALATVTSVPAPAPEPVRTKEQPRVPDEYLITLAPDVDRGIISEYYGGFGIKDLYALGGETFLLVLVNDPGPLKMEALIYDDSRVMVVQPNLVYWEKRSGSITK